MGAPSGSVRPEAPPSRLPSATVTREEIVRVLQHADENPAAALMTVSVFVGVLLERCK